MIDLEKIKELLIDSATHTKIDKYDLDTEFAKQACLYLRYANMQADVEEEKNTLRAQVDQDIRKEFFKNNKKAPSESYVKSTIEGNEEYIKLVYYISRIEGISKSLDHKMRSLEKLAILANASYYSAPRQPE